MTTGGGGAGAAGVAEGDAAGAEPGADDAGALDELDAPPPAEDEGDDDDDDEDDDAVLLAEFEPLSAGLLEQAASASTSVSKREMDNAGRARLRIIFLRDEKGRGQNFSRTGASCANTARGKSARQSRQSSMLFVR
jgi:hypothetical protein